MVCINTHCFVIAHFMHGALIRGRRNLQQCRIVDLRQTREQFEPNAFTMNMTFKITRRTSRKTYIIITP